MGGGGGANLGPGCSLIHDGRGGQKQSFKTNFIVCKMVVALKYHFRLSKILKPVI